MEIRKLNRATDNLQNVIAEFPIGAKTPNDLLPLSEKILNLKEMLRHINARRLTINAMIDYGITSNSSQEDFDNSIKALNESTTNFLINKTALKLSYQSQGLEDIIYNNAGTKEIHDKIRICFNKLLLQNMQMIEMNDKRKALMEKQHILKLECHNAIYKYEDTLKEVESKKNQELQENNPDIINNKEKIKRSIEKIDIMKKLITNLIASMHHKLIDNMELVELLNKHKETVNLETIEQLAQNKNSSNVI